MGLFLLPPMTLMSIGYFKMYKFVKQMNSKMGGSTYGKGMLDADKKVAEKEKKLAIRMLLIVFAFVGCWTPALVWMIACQGWPDGQAVKHWAFDAIVGWCGISNAALNPILYGWVNPAVEDAVKKMFSGAKVGTVVKVADACDGDSSRGSAASA